MSAGLAASRVLVCVLVSSMAVPVAVAQKAPAAPATKATEPGVRRPVAVINLDLTGDAEATKLATDMVRVLDAHPRLRGAPDPGAVAALYEPIDDPDPALIARADSARQQALQQIENFDYPRAVQLAQDGARELLTVTPSLAAKPYAELAFVRGKAWTFARKTTEARLAFAHVQRLDPARTLDAARENPDVVAAYTGAMAAGAPTGQLEVRGDGHVWIDGTEMGIAPGTFTVSAGLHAVWLTGIDRETRGTELEVIAGSAVIAQIPVAIASARTQVQRARQILARSPDSSARSAAMKRLTELVGVEDVLLLSIDADGAQVVQSWRAGDVESPGFSTPEKRGKRMPAELLEGLSPTPPPPGPEPVKFPPPIEHPSWIHSTSAKVVLGFSSVAIVGVGIYILTTVLRPDSVKFQPDIDVPDRGPVAR